MTRRLSAFAKAETFKASQARLNARRLEGLQRIAEARLDFNRAREARGLARIDFDRPLFTNVATP